ncbi:MAG: hypothetical protein SGARI_003147 [Bacillariaceae sp.]
MIATLHSHGCTDVNIDEFLDTTRSIRKTLDGEPITYQNLRKAAIQRTLETSPAFAKAAEGRQSTVAAQQQLGDDDIVQECYSAWEQERHLAAEDHLFEDAIETMQSLRETYPRTRFAAITNGAGDPLAMDRTLKPFFDFRISGEEEGVFPHRKPHPRIYEAALQENSNQQVQVEDKDVDGVWCHVGDCLANDVGASADCGAKAIWMCCLEEDDDGPDADAAATRLIDTVPKYSTATAEEMESRARQVAEGRSKVAASITRLSQLPDAIARILEEAKVAV